MGWRKMPGYKIGMYLEYEKLLDPEEGPVMVEQVAQVLRSSGFETAEDSEIPCIWYKTIKPQWEDDKDFYQYIASYTADQKNLLLKELENFMEEIGQEDERLVSILKGY